MLLSSFKVGGFKVFGPTVELNMVPKTKNTQHLSDNVISKKATRGSRKNLKSSIIYGGNNTGKTSLLHGLLEMKHIFEKGDINNFSFELKKNFCFYFEDIIRFEVSLLDESKTIVYGIEFESKDAIGEYLFSEGDLLFSRDLSGEMQGSLNDHCFMDRIKDLPSTKLIVPYVLEYTKAENIPNEFFAIAQFFSKIKFIDNRMNNIEASLFLEFVRDSKKFSILNKLISSTELFIEKRGLLKEEELLDSNMCKEILDDIYDIKMTDDKKDGISRLVNMLRITSFYKGKNNEIVGRPSIIFDSVGTNKFIVLAMHIISALLENNILLIDEFDSSLHHKLTRVLVILMNSRINNDAQFIMTSHDVKLLSPKLFRKDQVNFVLRDESGVEIITLDDFKANSSKDIRSDSNFEKMYVEGRIVPLPNTDIYQVIKEFSLYEQKKNVNSN